MRVCQAIDVQDHVDVPETGTRIDPGMAVAARDNMHKRSLGMVRRNRAILIDQILLSVVI